VQRCGRQDSAACCGAGSKSADLPEKLSPENYHPKIITRKLSPENYHPKKSLKNITARGG
jgi:hypothetical protein